MPAPPASKARKPKRQVRAKCVAAGACMQLGICSTAPACLRACRCSDVGRGCVRADVRACRAVPARLHAGVWQSVGKCGYRCVCACVLACARMRVYLSTPAPPASKRAACVCMCACMHAVIVWLRSSGESKAPVGTAAWLMGIGAYAQGLDMDRQTGIPSVPTHIQMHVPEEAPATGMPARPHPAPARPRTVTSSHCSWL